MARLTDRKAIYVALHIAIDTENSLIDAYRNNLTKKVPEGEPAVITARRRITAFERVLCRYYGGAAPPDAELFSGAKSVSIYDLLKNMDAE